MIKSLYISHFALIDELNVTLGPGFNVITGETGAGKSIILGALSCLLGGRPDSKALQPDHKAVIEAVFNVAGYESLRSYCLENEIDWDESEFILRREISTTGRSRAFVNDSPVNVTTLREIASQLVDVHSQHQNQQLASPDYQLKVIDSIADNSTEIEEYTALWNAYRTALVEYKTTKRRVTLAAEKADYNRSQLERINELKPVAGEQDELERERDIIANLADVKLALSIINRALADGDNNTLSLLKEAASQAVSLKSHLDGVDQLIERLDSVEIEVRDIADTFESIDRHIDADPSRLDYIEERLDDIYTLERRYNVSSVEELIELRDSLVASINDVDNGTEQLRELETRARRAKRAAYDKALQLSARRQEAAAAFAAKLKDTALPLGMKNLCCDIRVTQGEMTATGIDSVVFLFAFNKNQAPMPVGGAASGGEISRLMLSLKSIVAETMQLPTIIFDEVDTGVSGDIASRMGRMMRAITTHHQVIAITHLPQVASLAQDHYKVYKEDTASATATRLVALDADARVEEIAAMLSADNVNEAARANARSLLSQNTNDDGKI